MSRFISIGIIRRDILVLASSDDLESASAIAEASVREGQVNEAGVIDTVAWFTQVDTPVALPTVDLPPVAPAPLNLSPHVGGLDAAQVVGGPYLHDVNDTTVNVDGQRQVEGRTQPVAAPAGVDGAVGEVEPAGVN